jgi:tetratricopeptide (TPR) repeat protein
MRVSILVTLVLAGGLCGTAPSRAQDPQKDLHRAQELEKAGHVEQAIPIYLGVLKREAGNVEANLALGRAYLQTGHAAQAVESFERALQIQPGNADTVEWLGKSYLKAREPEKTVDLTLPSCTPMRLGLTQDKQLPSAHPAAEVMLEHSARAGYRGSIPWPGRGRSQRTRDPISR